MRTTRYVALLRGFNVGGRNKVAMADLRTAFEDAGYGTVRTYIQSGNVLFSSASVRKSLEPDIERLLETRFAVPVVVVVRAHAQLDDVVAKAPAGFGAAPATYHSDVVFLKAPLTATKAMRVVGLREGVDRAWPGAGVLYFERLSATLSKSRMSTIVSKPEYQQMTIRSWTTTTKLLALLDDGSEGGPRARRRGRRWRRRGGSTAPRRSAACRNDGSSRSRRTAAATSRRRRGAAHGEPGAAGGDPGGVVGLVAPVVEDDHRHAGGEGAHDGAVAAVGDDDRGVRRGSASAGPRHDRRRWVAP